MVFDFIYNGKDILDKSSMYFGMKNKEEWIMERANDQISVSPIPWKGLKLPIYGEIKIETKNYDARNFF